MRGFEQVGASQQKVHGEMNNLVKIWNLDGIFLQRNSDHAKKNDSNPAKYAEDVVIVYELNEFSGHGALVEQIFPQKYDNSVKSFHNYY